MKALLHRICQKSNFTIITLFCFLETKLQNNSLKQVSILIWFGKPDFYLPLVPKVGEVKIKKLVSILAQETPHWKATTTQRTVACLVNIGDFHEVGTVTWCGIWSLSGRGCCSLQNCCESFAFNQRQGFEARHCCSWLSAFAKLSVEQGLGG